MMPSPTKTVRKSVGVCRRTGMSRAQALQVIISVCDAAIAAVGTESLALESWLVDVRLVAVNSQSIKTVETIRDWLG